ncbi:MAG: DegT/DnrJ/EryC1/StrS family aminotransferase [Gemmatimonadota bacterium]
MKRSIDDLAIFGGTPRFDEPVHVGRPNIGDRDRLIGRISAALDRKWLTNDGPYVRELEARLARWLGVEHCIAMCNGTVATEVLVRALALSGQVVMPSFTFIATPHAYTWLGLEPVFCDVDAATHTIDPAHAAALIGEKTSAVVGVHLWGGGCDVERLTALTRTRGIALLFDAAHALGCTLDGRMIGAFGAAEVFSFHATKFFNTFEGGAVTTNDGGLARELRLMRNFGFRGYDDVATAGTNAKLNEISAAMGLTAMDELDALLELNRSRFEQYERDLAGIAGLRMVRPSAGERSNYQYVILEIGEGAGLTRDQLLALLWAENVRARRYFYPGCHRSAPYALRPSAPLPVTERLVREVLVLPAGGSASADDARAITALIRFALQNAGALAVRIPAQIPAGEVTA